MIYRSNSEYIILITSTENQFKFPNDTIHKNIRIYDITPTEIIVDFLNAERTEIYCLIRYNADINLLSKVIELALLTNARIMYKVEAMKHMFQTSRLFDYYNEDIRT